MSGIAVSMSVRRFSPMLRFADENRQRSMTMALKGEPRDMNRWREVVLDPSLRFPGESGDYRRARDELMEAEDELRRLNEKVIAQRRALPPGGLIQEDYEFEQAGDGRKIRFSELFAPGKDSLVIYNMMFPRWPEDRRAGAPCGKTAALPLVEQPCPSCTSVVDGLEGAAFHLAERTNLVVVAKTSPERLGTFAQERGWQNLRLLSSRGNHFNRDYYAEKPDGVQLAILNVFSRHADGIRHHWASELAFKHGTTTPLESIWPIYGILGVTREGPGDRAAYPNLQY
ncbi:DUF899 domain-containing protein [Burkholderia gladioli]|nr:hypothetical protein CEJ98_28650 [Burkholderia gladioli pv. gladioli]AWY50315.1 hypothetical protein A8H28_03425 [Burkholderia gladioli pv. gladioli]PRE24138.1 DUF899 domain-containing protein [Burkholderia gladioli]PRG44982.1 DUF899 domain-containing protein [Burkholderia gladioli]PRG87377.1 DUF899 domain-containing protein [Burkholderia gladioli]